ncbi:MAG: MBL fold metallo-hydrolase, partial [Actinomycetota bacterium]
MTKVYVLGAGNPVPTPDRFGTAFVVQVDDDYLMFDCGPAATAKMVKVGILPTQIDYLFFTHHHSDHNTDYPCFLLTRWDQSIGRESELEVRGPAPTAALTDRLLNEEYGAYNTDWLVRTQLPAHLQVHVDRGGTLPRKPPSVLATDIEPGFVCEMPNWKVTASITEHSQPLL